MRTPEGLARDCRAERRSAPGARLRVKNKLIFREETADRQRGEVCHGDLAIGSSSHGVMAEAAADI
jgi:hypothetical protein